MVARRGDGEVERTTGLEHLCRMCRMLNSSGISLRPSVGATVVALLLACGEDAAGPRAPELQVTLTGSADSVYYGRTIMAWVNTYDDGQAVPRDSVQWTSSDTLVAIVDSVGIVLGVGIGHATIAVVRGTDRGEMSVRVVAYEPMPGLRFTQLSEGGSGVCAIADDRSVHCSPYHLGDSMPAFAPLAGSADKVFSSFHTTLHSQCGLASDLRMYCWGMNAHGHFGDGSRPATPATDPALGAGGRTFWRLSVGGHSHSCGISTADSVLYCFGHNDAGQVGRSSPQGDDTTVAPVSGALRATDVAAGELHTCALDVAGTPHCWGSGFAAGTGEAIAADEQAPQRLSGPVSLESLAAGLNHTCGLASGGAAYCWGRGAEVGRGQPLTTTDPLPGPVATDLRFATIHAGFRLTCGTTQEDALHCWGAFHPESISDRIGDAILAPYPVARGVSFRDVASSARYACGLAVDGRLLCW